MSAEERCNRCGYTKAAHELPALNVCSKFQPSDEADRPSKTYLEWRKRDAMGTENEWALCIKHPGSEQIWELMYAKEPLEVRGGVETTKPLIESAHPEAFCEKCHRSNAVWFAPSELWNAAHGNWDILCPVCFIELAKAAGIDPTAWQLAPETFPDVVDAEKATGVQDDHCEHDVNIWASCPKCDAQKTTEPWLCVHGHENAATETHCTVCEWSRKHTIAGVLHERNCTGHPCTCGSVPRNER